MNAPTQLIHRGISTQTEKAEGGLGGGSGLQEYIKGQNIGCVLTEDPNCKNNIYKWIDILMTQKID